MRRKCYMLWMVMVVCLIFAAQPVYAANAPQLSASVDTAGVKKGETVKVKVSLKNNPGISTLGLELDYNAEELEYWACDWSSGLGGGMKMASDAQGIVNLSLVCDESYQADGTVATVSFRAKKDVSAVDVTLGLREISNENLSAVENCKVIKKVQVPAEAGTSKKQDKETKLQQTPAKQPKSSSSSQTAATEEKTVSKTAETTEKTVKTTANTASANTARATGAENAKLDESYQTGVLAGADVLVVIASVCVSAAFIMWNEQKRGTLD